MKSKSISLRDIFEKVTNDPEKISSSRFLNVSTSTYCKNPNLYTILNAVVLSKQGINQIIFYGNLTPEIRIENWKELIEELIEKTHVTIKYGDEIKRFDKKGNIEYIEFPTVKNKKLIDILTKDGENIRKPFVWEDNGIKRGKDPKDDPYYTSGILAHRLVILLSTLGPKKFEEYLNINEDLEKKLENVHLAYGCGERNMYMTVSNAKRARILQENKDKSRKIILYVFPEFSITYDGRNIRRRVPVKIYKNKELVESFEYSREDDPKKLIKYLEKAKKIEIYIEIPRKYCNRNVSDNSIKEVFKSTIPRYQELRIYL